MVVIGGMGGRLDQEMASFHSLFKWGPFFDRIVLYGRPSIAYLLPPGKHHIIPLPAESTPGNYCGYFPLAGATPSVKVTTTGLGYDVSQTEFQFGKFVSSSNYIKPDVSEVRIETSGYLLFTHSPARVTML